MKPQHRWIRVVVLAALGGGIGWYMGRASPEGAWLPILAWGLLWIVPSMALHEAGHALAGRAMGFRIFWIRYGSGPHLGSFKLLGTRHEVFALPFNGLTVGAPTVESRPRLRRFVFSAGGLTMHALVIAGILGLGGPEIRQQVLRPAADGPIFWASLVWANAFLLVANLVPGRVSAAGMTILNDGAQLLSIPRLTDAELERQRGRIAALEGYEDLREARYAAAAERYREAIAAYGSTWQLRHDLAIAELGMGRAAVAAERFRELLAEEEVAKSPALTRLIRNNVAYALVTAPEATAAQLEEADALSEENLPARGSAPVNGTRGAVLVRRGEREAGRPHLLAAWRRHSAPSAKAGIAAWLALAFPDEAERWLARARSLAPEVPEIPLVEALRAVESERDGALTAP